MREPNSGSFQPGNPGGPGRPKGSRHRLGEAFIKALADDFEKHGIKVLETVREKGPVAYAKIVASLLPKRRDIFSGIATSPSSGSGRPGPSTAAIRPK
jgi:hypothetical protein